MSTSTRQHLHTPPLEAGDRVGFLAALACAVHCALLPALAGLLPWFGVPGMADFDQGVVVLASLLGLTTIGMGYRRHRSPRPALLLLAGLPLLWWGAFGSLHRHDLDHAAVMSAGGVLLALAHLGNLRRVHALCGPACASTGTVVRSGILRGPTPAKAGPANGDAIDGQG
ncbi:MAG: hypothetical protein KatS3mg126_0172 [Lysobacteraceae bacterium]|nr:MAG: hypothetical protein KatS3mg126_0172 [Xanthomonadaceae bacterium]